MRTWTGLVGLALIAQAAGVPGAVAQMHTELLVSADWVEAHAGDANVVVLQAESRRDVYQRGHIPGARFLDMNRLVWDGSPPWGAELRPASDVEAALEEVGVHDGLHHLVVYSSNPLMAARAFMTLEVMGLRGRVQMLDGGWGGWTEEGRAVSTDTPRFSRGDVTLSPRDDIVVSAEWVLERLEAPDVALIDARPDDEYTGADGGMGGSAHAGHIPGAVQMYWEEIVESRAVPRLRERSELEAMFRAAGADPGDTVVAYCMVGLRASFTYFTARMLGYETKFYDGSWHEWGTRADLPYVRGSSPR